MGNKVNLEFAGDATKLQKASKDADKSLETVGQSATSASDDMKAAGKGSDQYLDRIGKLGAGVEGMSGAFDSAGAAVQSMVDIQNAGRERAARLARANADVEQAMIDSKQAAVDLRQAQEDLNQSQLDGQQAAIDVEQAEIDARQAKIDVTTATKEYQAAVAEYGAGSTEAAQAAVDLTQAESDLKQAQLDGKQAAADANQAKIDATQAAVDATQATRDGKDAQLDLNDAMAEANPSGLAKFAENIQLVTPLLSGLVGVVGLVTAAQWAWNAAQLASPTTWIILAIVAVIAIIVVIATKTDWFQRLWRAAWGGIKSAASAVGSWFKDTLYGKWIKGAWEGIVNAGRRVLDWFAGMGARMRSSLSRVASIITAPYRAAFNLIARAWNATVGSLSFTIPGWVPGLGGKGFDVPDMPTFHSGGVVPGTPGSDVPIMAQAGERVTAAVSSSSTERWIRLDAGRLGDALLSAVAGAVEARGGRVTALGVKVVGGAVRT